VTKHREIERKFLVKALPSGWNRCSHARIEQGYLPTRAREFEVRLRNQDSRCFITIKSGRGRARLEEEIEIPRSRFAALWPLTRGARLSKTRYRISYRDKLIEVDVYQGRLRGLRTAEVEFDSKRESQSFQPPQWLGREVTGSGRYANQTLARRGGTR
jgi:CYTH domain-containing protein